MATTIVSTNTIGAGVQFTFTANGDGLVVMPGVTLGSTTAAAISSGAFSNLAVTILGSVVSASQMTASANSSWHVGPSGSITSTLDGTGSTVLFLNGVGQQLVNDGTIYGGKTIGVLTNGGSNSVVNAGSISAASGAFLGLSGSIGDQLVNSGTIQANAYGDDIRNTRYNNAVFTEGGNTLITNHASGTLIATSSEGAGVALGFNAGGSVVTNHGLIQSAQYFGISASGVDLGQAPITIRNFGTISGGDGAINGSINADLVINSGQLIGDVLLGDGADVFDGRGGIALNSILLGAGDDSFIGNAAWAETVDGGTEKDTLDFRLLDGATVALDDTFETAGSAMGDSYTGFEVIMGSRSGADTLRGNAAVNSLFGAGGEDWLDGAGGNDFLRGGNGSDILTGGAGNDTFAFLAIYEISDRIIDFSSAAAGNNDRFQISAASFGGGLVSGALAANQFRSRADNVAQDADDRFIFDTSDQTLWFDVDGNGSAVAVMVAQLQFDATMTSLDIVLI